MGKVKVRNLTKRFDNEFSLDNISFDINLGSITVFIGRSGEGKSTVLKCLLGMYKKDAGEIIVDEESVKNLEKYSGFSFQQNSFYKDLTVMENLRYFSIQRGITNEEKIRKSSLELLRDVKLDKSKEDLAGNLSGGMQKRLDIAISMIGNPPILILDEPTTGLDSDLRHLIYLILRNYKRKNKTVLFTTHLIDEIKEFADDAIVLKNKKIQYFGPINQMKSCWNLSLGITTSFDYNSVKKYDIKQKYDVINIKFATKEEALQALQKIKEENDEGIKSIQLETFKIKNYM